MKWKWRGSSHIDNQRTGLFSAAIRRSCKVLNEILLHPCSLPQADYRLNQVPCYHKWKQVVDGILNDATMYVRRAATDCHSLSLRAFWIHAVHWSGKSPVAKWDSVTSTEMALLIIMPGVVYQPYCNSISALVSCVLQYNFWSCNSWHINYSTGETSVGGFYSS